MNLQEKTIKAVVKFIESLIRVSIYFINFIIKFMKNNKKISLTIFVFFMIIITANAIFGEDKKITKIKNWVESSSARDNQCKAEQFITVNGVSRDETHKNSEKYPYPDKKITVIAFKKTCLTKDRSYVDFMINLYDKDDSDNFSLGILSSNAAIFSYQQESPVFYAKINNIEIKNSVIHVTLFKKNNDIETIEDIAFNIINDGTRQGKNVFATIAKDNNAIKIVTSNQREVEEKNIEAKNEKLKSEQERINKIVSDFISKYESLYDPYDFLSTFFMHADFYIDFFDSNGFRGSNSSFTKKEVKLSCKELLLQNLGRDGYGSTASIPIEAIDTITFNARDMGYGTLLCNKSFDCIHIKNVFNSNYKIQESNIKYNGATISINRLTSADVLDFKRPYLVQYEPSEIKAWEFQRQIEFFKAFHSEMLNKILIDMYAKYKKSCTTSN